MRGGLHGGAIADDPSQKTVATCCRLTTDWEQTTPPYNYTAIHSNYIVQCYWCNVTGITNEGGMSLPTSRTNVGMCTLIPGRGPFH